MLEVLLGQAVITAVTRVVAAAVEDRDIGRGDISALTGSLIQAIASRGPEATIGVEALSRQLERIERTLYEGPFKSGVQMLQDAARNDCSPSRRSSLIASARERFSDSLGHAPDDALFTTAPAVYYALASLAEGSAASAKEIVERASRRLDEAVLITHRTVADGYVEIKRITAKSLPGEVFNYVVGRGVHSEPESFERLRRLLDERTHLRSLRASMRPQSAKSYPIDIAAHRWLYNEPRPALLVDLPRGLPADVASLFITASLPPVGKERELKLAVTNPWPGPLELTWAVSRGRELGARGNCPRSTIGQIMPGHSETYTRIITIQESYDHLIIDADLTMPGTARPVTLRFLVDTGIPNPLLMSFADRRAIKAFEDGKPSGLGHPTQRP